MSNDASHRTSVRALAALLVLALVAIAYLWVRYDEARDDNAAAQERVAELESEQAAGEEALAEARSLLVDMTTYSHQTVAEDFGWLDRIGDEELRKRMAANVEALSRIIKDSEARAEGKVVDAASRVVGPDQVEVVAFVDQVIRDGEQKGVKVEEQRISMTLVRDGDTWSIDRLDLQSGNNAG
ncbi:hypothetical protein FXB39_12975 [Nocardioides sp. BGMRC 2183]|nr:hypothetical protein FXB39_12975 [Nocardioides sp. BGMRC 2183]